METLASQLELDSFTPVQRRLSTINNRQQQSDLQKEWTATRCNRLLRALTSRIAILRKDISRLQAATTSKPAEVTSRTYQGRVNASSDDADWIHPRKRVKRTYSNRGGKANNDGRATSDGIKFPIKGGPRLIPGEISVPTPILNRARGEPPRSQYSVCVLVPRNIQSPDSKRKKRPRVRDGEAQFQLSQTMRGIRNSIPAGRYTIYEGIYYGLDALLRATASEGPETKQQGPRSLLSLCLRAIPDYVTNEERLLAAQLEKTRGKSALDRRDIATEIYDDLEAFGSLGHGWKHLRTVVRSHGIQVICKAIRDGLLDVEFHGILVSLCVNMRATSEAETLLSTVLAAGRLTRPKTVFTRFDDDSANRPLSMFWDFVNHRSCFSYQYRQLSSMIADGILPISWLATKEFVTFWARVVHQFSQDMVDPEAISFLNTVLPILATYGDLDSDTTSAVLLEAVKRTFSSLIATLAAIVILSKENMIQAEESELSPPEYCYIVTLFQTCIAQWKLCRSFNVNGSLLVVAALLVGSYNEDFADIDLVDLLLKHLCHARRSTKLSTPHNDLVVLVCSIARFCGRGASSSGFAHLQHLHTMLENIAHDRESDGGKIVEEIIIDSAFAFAQQAPDRRHLDYAANIEAKFHIMKPGSMDMLPPGNQTKRGAYRWEEGIGEWVTATPAAGSLKSNRITEYTVDGTEWDAPFIPSGRRSLSKYYLSSTLVSDLVPSSDVDSEDEYSDISLPGSTESVSSISEDGSDEDDIMATSTKSKMRSRTGDFYESDDELTLSTPLGENSDTDELCTPYASSTASGSSRGFDTCRQYVERDPRPGGRVLRHGLQWQLFDESDDELSSLSITSQHNSARQGLINSASAGAYAKSQAATRANGSLKRSKSTGSLRVSFPSDSEDELGI